MERRDTDPTCPVIPANSAFPEAGLSSDADADAMEIDAGTVIGERYEIRRRLGSGAIGVVYKAIDTRLGNRAVAIKMLSATIVAGPLAEEARGRFVLEAQALSAIRDDHVVSVLNFGFTGTGVPYLVMEYLDGQDLESILEASGGLLSVRRAVDLALDVCGGVHICHNEEIVHRDLKPANIFVERTPRGYRAKVVDFGISKTAASATLSHPGITMGTPRYMAPEQLDLGQTDKRSDQYSIGLILYRCLTGQLPEKGGPEPSHLRPEVPENLNGVVMRALARNPEERFQSVYAFGRTLVPFASEEASARWREYYRTPPQPRSLENSQPVPLFFTKPDGSLDPRTIRVSYDAATRLGIVDEARTNDEVPHAILARPGGTALDHRSESLQPAPRPVPTTTRRSTFRAGLILAVALAATGGGAWSFLRWPGRANIQAPRPGNAEAPARTPSSIATPHEPAASPSATSPPVSRTQAVAPDHNRKESAVTPARKGQRRGKPPARESGRATAPDAESHGRDADSRYPILE
jgi:serine/threonine-protein kinase